MQQESLKIEAEIFIPSNGNFQSEADSKSNKLHPQHPRFTG
jgi:hypothetical protein